MPCPACLVWLAALRVATIAYLVRPAQHRVFISDTMGITYEGSLRLKEFRMPNLFSFVFFRAVYEGHEDTVQSVERIEGKTFVTGGLDREIGSWGVGLQKPIRRLRGHSKGVTAIQVIDGARPAGHVGREESKLCLGRCR